MIVLETERLLFRDHKPGDLEPFCALQADAAFRRYVGGKPRTREASEEKFRSVFLPPVVDRKGLWAAVFKPEWRYIGYCGVYPHSGPTGPVPGEGVLAFYLDKEYWGRGLATEAGRAFVDFGFATLKLSRIVATVDVENGASIRIVQKLGFRWCGMERHGSRSINEYELVSPVRRGPAP